MIKKIISGGQTGADRAAIDTAIKLNIPHGGWCPRGRMAEDGAIPEHYLLSCPTDADTDRNEPAIHAERTKLNIRDSDGTLIIAPSFPLPTRITDGTHLTISEAAQREKPLYIVNLSKNPQIPPVLEWIKTHRILTLNIAGPRESQCPGIYRHTHDFLEKLFSGIRRVLSPPPADPELINLALLQSLVE